MSGNKPIKDDLILTRGADFVSQYVTNPTDPQIDPGTVARIEITDGNDTTAPIVDTWNAAQVSANTIGFRVESEQADLIPARSSYRLLVKFPDTPTLDYCWYYGTVKRIQ